MTKIEEVARAIHISDKQKTSRYFSNEVMGCSWEQLSIGVQQSYLSEARAAIKAMKNPTDKMVDAGKFAPGGSISGAGRAVDTYKAMIDAALEEK